MEKEGEERKEEEEEENKEEEEDAEEEELVVVVVVENSLETTLTAKAVCLPFACLLEVGRLGAGAARSMPSRM